MRIGLIHRALVALSVLIGLVAPVSAARAAGSCGTGTPFVGTASGNLVLDQEDWWRTLSLGNTDVTIRNTEDQIDFEVFDEDCSTRFCGYWGLGSTCEVRDYTGMLNVRVHSWDPTPSSYSLTATTGPGSTSQCDVAGLPICVSVAKGDVVRDVTVASPDVSTAPVTSVVGTVDIYDFALPTGGIASVPCVVLVVNDTTVDPCRDAGGTDQQRIATLVNGTVPAPSVTALPGPNLGVCAAQVTFTVADIGIRDFPAYVLC